MAAGNTYEAIATNTLGSTAASVTFSSIPSTYTDLVIIVDANAGSSTQLRLQFNGDTGSNYSITLAGTDGSSGFAFGSTNQTSMNIAGLGTIGGVNTVDIMNYANTTTFKTAIGKWNLQSSGYREVGAKVGLWRSTSAITSVVLFPSSGNFTTGSTFNLFGIKAA